VPALVINEPMLAISNGHPLPAGRHLRQIPSSFLIRPNRSLRCPFQCIFMDTTFQRARSSSATSTMNTTAPPRADHRQGGTPWQSGTTTTEPLNRPQTVRSLLHPPVLSRDFGLGEDFAKGSMPRFSHIGSSFRLAFVLDGRISC